MLTIKNMIVVHNIEVMSEKFNIESVISFFPCGSAVIEEPRPPHVGEFPKPYLSTFGRTPWTGVSPSQGLCLHRTTQHRKTRANLHALSGIQTHDPSIQAAKTHTLDHLATNQLEYVLVEIMLRNGSLNFIFINFYCLCITVTYCCC
jgi:hypothetical protein